MSEGRGRAAVPPSSEGEQPGDESPVTPDRATGGLLSSLRRLGSTLLETAEVRLELVGTEVAREKLRIARGLLLAAAGGVLSVGALLLLSAAIVLMVDAQMRLAVLVALGVAYAALAAWLLHAARGTLRTPPEGAFALSRAELRRDADALRTPPP